jgi:hypothetical protein
MGCSNDFPRGFIGMIALIVLVFVWFSMTVTVSLSLGVEIVECKLVDTHGF